MNRPDAFPLITRRSILAAAVACCFAPSLGLANPTGGKVAHGQASFSAQGSVLTVTNTPGAIINWQSFSIGATEMTRFVQQSAASSVLNRVVGGQSSSILGALQSNGRVFLINPNGIIFGAGARIDTAGLVASTLNIMDADFLRGRMLFRDTPGAKSITNEGEIRTPAGGKVFLISPEGVTNSGIIHSPKGEVILAAGKTVEIADSANPEIRVEVSAPDAQALNLGKIVAESGRIGIYGSLVANRGTVSADSAVVGENGRIVFKASRDATLAAGSMTSANGPSGGSVEVSSAGTTLVAGEVSATGSAGSGGEVRVLGENVGLIEAGRIDVSGERGGGTALVGGDLRGANPEVRNAQMTYVGADANIKADAVTSGDGGKVIVWADDTTRSYGHISARGGERSGNGGFVETSGKRALDVRRGPDLQAPAGKGGTWLLDPNDIEIVAGYELTTNSGAPFFAPLGDSSKVGVDLINAQLDFGSDVVINTTSQSGTTGSEAGNITVSAPIVKTLSTPTADNQSPPSTQLRLQAHNDINITATGSITSTGDPLNVVLEGSSNGATAAGGATIGGAITTNGGSLSVRVAKNITSTAAINTVAPASATSPGSVTGGSVTLTSTTGKVDVGAAIASGSSVTLSGGGGVAVRAPVSTGTSSFFSASVSDNASASTLSIEPGASVSAASVSLVSDNMDIQGTATASSGGVAVRPFTSGRAISIGTESAGALSLTQSELDHLLSSSSFSLGSSVSGAITVSSPITSALSGAITVQSGASYTQNAGVSLAGSVSLNAPTVTLSAPLTLTNSAGVFLSADALNVNGTLTSAGPITVNTRTFNRPIALGVAAPAGGALEMTAAQVNNLVAPTVRLNTSGAITIAGSIAPSGITTLSLASSNSSITEAAGATVTVPNLALSARTTIDFGQDNDVASFAASTCCDTGSISFVNKPGKALTVGTVESISGVRVNNFSGTGAATLRADDMTIASGVFVNSGDITLAPRQSSTAVTLGADTAGTLGITNTELGRIQATKLTIAGDRINIDAPVSFIAAATTLAPASTGRPVSIVATKGNPNELELLPGEITAVSGATVILGGPSAGPVSVKAPTSVPGGIATFTLHSGDAATGLSVLSGAPVSATNNIGLIADTMAIGDSVSSTSGSIAIAPSTAGLPIELGSQPAGALGLTVAQLGLFSAPNGGLNMGSGVSGPVSVSDAIALTAVRDVSITSGGAVTVGVDGPSLSAPGNVALTGASVMLEGPVASATAGNVILTADDMTINANVTATSGNVVVKPGTYRAVDLGTKTPGQLGLLPAELQRLVASSGMVEVGDAQNTANVDISAAISGLSSSTLSLYAGDGSISQASGATLSVPNLAARAYTGIDLTQDNSIGTVAAYTDFGNVSITNAAATPLAVGAVGTLSGITTYGYYDSIFLRADRLDVAQAVSANDGYGQGVVSVAPRTAGTPIELGSKPGTLLGLLSGEVNQLYGGTVSIGDANTGSIAITAPVAIAPGRYGGQNTNLEVTTAQGSSVTANSTLSVPGNMTIESDAMTFAATASSSSGNIWLRPATAGALINVGGADAPGVPGTVPIPPTLGLDGTDLANLAPADTLIVGSANAGNASVSHAGTLASSVTVWSGGQISIDNNPNAPGVAFGAAQTLGLTADTIALAGAAGITAGTGITISPNTASRDVTLGVAPGAKTGTALELDTDELGKMRITGSGALAFDTGGTLKTAAPLAFTAVPDVSLSGATLDHSGGALSAPGNIVLRADAMPSAGFQSVTSTGGGQITIAPRSEYNAMTVGTTGGGLVVDPSLIGQLTTTGTLQLGDSATWSLAIDAPLVATGFGALALIADSNITQSAPISATNLRVQTGDYSSVTLTHTDNAIGTVAAKTGYYGSFNLTTAGALTVGTVGPTAGIAADYGTVTLKADGLNVVSNIDTTAGSGYNDYGTVTLAPRLAGGAIDLGGDSGFGLTNDEINRVSAYTLNIGSTNPTGSISVTSAVDRAQGGELRLITASGGTINVNAALGTGNTEYIALEAGYGSTGGTINVGAPVGSSNASEVSMRTGSGGAANIGGAVTAVYGVDVMADTINVTQPITATSEYSEVNLSNIGLTGSINIGGEIKSGYYGVSVTGKTIAVNAPVTSDYSYSYTDYLGNTYSYHYGSVFLGARSGTSGSSVAVNQAVTAGEEITVRTDSVAINAPMVTLGSSMTLQPLTTGTPISLGTETAGAFSLTSAELALLSTDILTIGSLTSGPLSINAPISSSTLQTLSLQSGDNITQLATAPIELSYVITDPVTGTTTPAATLNVRSASGTIDLSSAPNNVNSSITGSAGTSGTDKDFLFTNLSPLKLQNISPALALAPSGKVVFNSPAGNFVPPPPPPPPPPTDLTQAALLEAAATVVNPLVSEVTQTANTQDEADKDADARKEDAEDAQREEEKKEGKKACS